MCKGSVQMKEMNKAARKGRKKETSSKLEEEKKLDCKCDGLT